MKSTCTSTSGELVIIAIRMWWARGVSAYLSFLRAVAIYHVDPRQTDLHPCLTGLG